LQLLQEFKVKAGSTVNKLQVTFAILNIGNMLNKKWGHSIYDSNQQFALINYKGLTGTTPNFTYDASGQTNGYPYLLSDLLSRWRGQIGLRYIFN
jgi:hypothetical protein